MQLAVIYDFIVIPESLIKYRILGDSLTAKTIGVRGAERRYTLDKILSEHPGIKHKYADGIKEAYARGIYYDAQFAIALGKKIEGRNFLYHIKFNSPIYFALYLMLFLPVNVWHFLQSKKYSR
jgi:hypothetical protein